MLRPMEGVRVLEVAQFTFVPSAGAVLADWGADVIKIEMPEGLDQGDPMGGPRGGPDFQNLHRNKRGLTLNLKSESGRDVLRRLVTRADEDEVRQWVRERLRGSKTPDRVVFVDEFPTTPTGKVVRRELVSLVSESSAQPA